jgi:hypothetical protein
MANMGIGQSGSHQLPDCPTPHLPIPRIINKRDRTAYTASVPRRAPCAVRCALRRVPCDAVVCRVQCAVAVRCADVRCALAPAHSAAPCVRCQSLRPCAVLTCGAWRVVPAWCAPVTGTARVRCCLLRRLLYVLCAVRLGPRMR